MGGRQERAHSSSLGCSQRQAFPHSSASLFFCRLFLFLLLLLLLLLMLASGNLSFVQALLADSNINARDERGCTPLHLAASGGFNTVVSALLQAKAKPSAVDNAG
jgi:ankyrin repeat protein